MTREQKELHQQVSKKCQVCLSLSLGLVISLGVVKMVLSNRASTWGHNLQRIELEVDTVKKQNLQLRSQITKKAGGLDKITLQAKEKGFSDKPNIKFFIAGPDVAQVLP
jgi:hypothetical protein